MNIKNTLAYKIGYVLASTIGICAIIIIIALTSKLLLWLF